MRRQLTRTILVTGTVAAALSLGVPTAMAVTTWTVSGGPNFTATGTVTLTDVTANVSFTCTATASGTVADETHGTNTAIGSITSFTLRNCKSSSGITGMGGNKSGTTWTINISSYSNGVVTGAINGVNLVMMFGSGLCTTEITGTAGFTYTNASSVLQLTATGDNLGTASISGICPGLRAGDRWTLTGSLTVTGSPVNPIQISSP